MVVRSRPQPRSKRFSMAATTSGFVAKAFEKYFYEFSMYDQVRSSREAWEQCRCSLWVHHIHMSTSAMVLMRVNCADHAGVQQAHQVEGAIHCAVRGRWFSSV